MKLFLKIKITPLGAILAKATLLRVVLAKITPLRVVLERKKNGSNWSCFTPIASVLVKRLQSKLFLLNRLKLEAF
jgi:hypothetical protein